LTQHVHYTFCIEILPMTEQLKLLTGSSHPELAQLISNDLNIPLGACYVGKFSNNETTVEIGDSIRSGDVYIIQPICNSENNTLNDNLMELLVIIDTAKRASANRITAVVPYFAYARQNSKERSRSPITCKLIANMLTAAGVSRVITMDLNAGQVAGFFNMPVDNMYAEPLIAKYIRKKVHGEKVVLIAPDPIHMKRASAVAADVEGEVGLMHRQVKYHTNEEEMVLVGDVKGKIAVIITDIADTCVTIELASETLMKKGAATIYAVASHGVLSEAAVTRINRSPISELAITNSIPLSKEARECTKIKVINISHMVAEVIRRTHFGESVTASDLFTII